MRLVAFAAAVLCLTSCQQRHSEQPESVVRNKPPQRKDIIEAVLASHAIPLSVSPSCASVGTKPGDTTIGAYLSGFLSELADPGAKNWLETKLENAKGASGNAVWRCEFTIRHTLGEDEWGWGVRFDIGQADGGVIPTSFVCIGGG